MEHLARASVDGDGSALWKVRAQENAGDDEGVYRGTSQG